MLPEIALSAALTLGATTTAQTEMPFTMYFASVPESISMDVDNTNYNPHHQLTTTVDGNTLVAEGSSYCQKSSATTDKLLGSDSDSDSSQDD